MCTCGIHAVNVPAPGGGIAPPAPPVSGSAMPRPPKANAAPCRIGAYCGKTADSTPRSPAAAPCVEGSSRRFFSQLMKFMVAPFLSDAEISEDPGVIGHGFRQRGGEASVAHLALAPVVSGEDLVPGSELIEELPVVARGCVDRRERIRWIEAELRRRRRNELRDAERAGGRWRRAADDVGAVARFLVELAREQIVRQAVTGFGFRDRAEVTLRARRGRPAARRPRRPRSAP